MTIRAIYTDGIFRPTEQVDLPDQCVVEIDVQPVELPAEAPAEMSEGLRKVYEILGRRHSSGFTDTAERYNEYQPRVPGLHLGAIQMAADFE